MPAKINTSKLSRSKPPLRLLPPSLEKSVPPEDEELLELDELDELEEELDEELLELDELLALDELLEADEPAPLNTVARFEVALMPLAPLISRFPQLERLAGLKFCTISSAVQQLPFPDQDQPI